MPMEGTRLNKWLSERGICSRREADRLLTGGHITLNGQPAIPGTRVIPGDLVAIDGKTVGDEKPQQVILALNKPRGIVCTTASEPGNVVDFVGFSTRIYPVGRLDKDSEGLLLLTNDGSLVNLILKSRHYHEKEYEVTIDRPVSAAFLQSMKSGVPIRIERQGKVLVDTVTRPCRAWKTGPRTFHIVLTQGLNRQIRRMCQAQGVSVSRLKRVRIMGLTLGNLTEGEWRILSDEEKRALLEQEQG